MKNATTLALSAVGAVLVASPALASASLPIPEPTSLSLAVAAAAGAVVAWRAGRRK